MPNLNRLADESVVFDEAYVTQPVCTPSRSALLTGLWPHQNGCTENNVALWPQVRCLPELIARGKYVTAHHGKWHLGDEIFAQHGFEEFISIEDEYGRYYSPGRDQDQRSSYHQFLIEAGFAPQNGVTLAEAKQRGCLRSSASRPLSRARLRASSGRTVTSPSSSTSTSWSRTCPSLGRATTSTIRLKCLCRPISLICRPLRSR